MKTLESSNAETWTYLNIFSNGARNTFPRIALDQAIVEKANKNTKTSSGTKAILKYGAVVCYSITVDYRRFYFFRYLKK